MDSKHLEILKLNPSTADIPVIVLSASLHSKKSALNRGACYFIQKPFDSKAILSALNSVFLSQQDIGQLNEDQLNDGQQKSHHRDTRTPQCKSPKFSAQITDTNLAIESFQPHSE